MLIDVEKGVWYKIGIAMENSTDEDIVVIFHVVNAKIRVKNSTKDSIEFIYELSQKMINTAEKKNSESIIEEVYKLEDIKYVNVVCQNDELYR